MTKKTDYIPLQDRKKILLLCDDIRMHSGIGNIGKELVFGTVQRFKWVNLGAGVVHPQKGKIIDVSEEVNEVSGIEDSYVRIVPSEGYGTPEIIRSLLDMEKPDAIMIFTDPRYWVWLFQMEREIRSKIPIIYLNIWDDLPAPLYNRPYYESVDTLIAISKQTKLINELVLGDKRKEKIIEYVPHGVNEKTFYPIDKNKPDYKDFTTVKKELFGEKELDFIALFNSRNIRRKGIPDLLLGYRYFCDLIGEEKARKCGLILHTEPVLDAGTDLVALKNALCDSSYINVYFSTAKLPPRDINFLYNLADVTVLPSSNEGWGLSLTESMMAGTMIIANMTGGMQDQMRVEDDKGNWFTPSADIPSNHRGTFRKNGKWAIPVYPTTRHLVGSPPTPYIFDDTCSAEDLGKALHQVWSLTPEERTSRGLEGRKWCLSEEARMSSTQMSQKIANIIDSTLSNFKPRTTADLIKIEDSTPDLIPHKLFDY